MTRDRRDALADPRPLQRRARVVAHRRIARDHYQLTLACPAVARAARPGQFVHLQCAAPSAWRGGGPLLRRPFSLYDVDPRRGACDLIYKVVGLGTETLRAAAVGNRLDLLGPLGTAFTLPTLARQVILIGGGVGIPPLYFWATRLLSRGAGGVARTPPPRLTVFLGARTKAWVLCAAAFRRLGVPVQVATDDGTQGHRGSVVDLIATSWRSMIRESCSTALYLCGPTPMMQAAAALAARWRVPAQVSLEERMGCAMGVCMGCIVEIAGPHATAHKRFQRVCTGGPVFPAETVVWSKS